MKLASVLNGGQNGFPGGGGCGQCMGAHNPLFGGHQHGGGGLNFGISGGFRMTAGNFLGGLV